MTNPLDIAKALKEKRGKATQGEWLTEKIEDGNYDEERIIALDDILPALRALEKIVQVSGSSTEHWHIANKALEPFREILEGK